MGFLTNNEIAENIFSLIKDKKTTDLVSVLERVIFLDKQRLVGKSKILLSSLKEIIYKQEKILEVNLSSAVILDNHQKEELILKLKKRYDANEIIFNEIVDKSLLGGFKVEINNEIIDLTLRNKISKLQEHLASKI